VKRVSLTAGNITLVRDGQPVNYREKDAARVFSRERVPLHVDLGGGKGRAFVWSSDFGHDYVSLNADYRS
jgi:glutamate N-acetyltransferase/amino-acid N-acetyltransferase